MSIIQPNDKILVQRGTTLFSAPADMSTVQDTDLILVNRGGVDYHCTVADWKASTGSGAALPTIDKPSITSPAAGSTTVALAPTLTSSAFRGNNGATHISTDWQITTAADTAFATPVQQSMGNTGAKTSWTAAAFAIGTSLICRVRYHGGSSIVSPWSDSVAFTTLKPAPPLAGAGEVQQPWAPGYSRSAGDALARTHGGATFGNAYPQCSVFEDDPRAAGLVHVSTDWRIKNQAGAVVWSSMADRVNLRTLVMTEAMAKAAGLDTSLPEGDFASLECRFHYVGSVSGWGLARNTWLPF